MLTRPTREERFGCLFCLISMRIGVWAGVRAATAHAERLLATDPDATLCGLPVLAGMIGGAMGWGLGGMVFGMILSRLIPQRVK